MHTIKLLLTYYLNISVQAANLSNGRIESSRKNRFGSENRIETFLPELECSTVYRPRLCRCLLVTTVQNAKRLNRSRCHLGYELVGFNEPCMGGGGSPSGKGRHAPDTHEVKVT